MTAGGPSQAAARQEQEQHTEEQTKDEASTRSATSEPQLSLFDGESLTNVVSPIAYGLSRKRTGGGEFDGALHITNFRLILQRTGPGKAAFGSGDSSLEWVSFPMGCIKSVAQADEDPLAIAITAKDLRSCRIRFESNNALFVSTLTQIIGSMAAFAQTSAEKSFAITHSAAASRRRSAQETKLSSKGPEGSASTASSSDATEEDGWLVYDEEREFTRQGVIRPISLDSPTPAGVSDVTRVEECSSGDETEASPRWRLFHNRSHKLVPTYPLYVVVPGAMTDAEIRAVAAYRCKGRLPAVTWMDPDTKAVLARSAQPLAGLGGKSCVEDEKLLGFFCQKGREGEHPRSSAVSTDEAPIHAKSGNASDRVDIAKEEYSASNKPGDPSRSRVEGDRGDVNGVRGSKNKTKPDLGESFLDFVGMSSWTSPWSVTRVNVQETQQKQLNKKAPMPPIECNQELERKQQHHQQDSSENSTLSKGVVGMSDGGEGRRSGAKVRPASRGGVATGGDRAAEPRLCVLDARTAVAALGNQLVGKGVETGAGYGSSTQLVFSGIGNVHAVRDAFEELRNALDPVRLDSKGDRWREETSRSITDMTSRGLGFSKAMDLKQVLGEELEEAGTYTLWPRLLRQILGASLLAARLLRVKGCSVLVHCSDGWDRTPQICSTVQLLLDPYYRTLDGFCVLIEKEWNSFGHSFWARCMGGSRESVQDDQQKTSVGVSSSMSPTSSFAGGAVKDYEELSPIFIQFLDLVHNIVAQFPTAFEFTESLLAFVAEHTYSGLFGTFLCDTERRKLRLKLKEKTVSVWTVVLRNRTLFTNASYKETHEPLWPSLATTKIRLWERQHCRVPFLRPHHLFNDNIWEDHVSVTWRLLDEVTSDAQER